MLVCTPHTCVVFSSRQGSGRPEEGRPGPGSAGVCPESPQAGFSLPSSCVASPHQGGTWIRLLVLLLLGRFSCVRLCAALWTVAHQAPRSMGFSRQEYWSGLPFSSPGEQSQRLRNDPTQDIAHAHVRAHAQIDVPKRGIYLVQLYCGWIYAWESDC